MYFLWQLCFQLGSNHFYFQEVFKVVYVLDLKGGVEKPLNLVDVLYVISYDKHVINIHQIAMKAA